MRNKVAALCLAMTLAISVMAGDKESGTTVLKDFQPAGTTSKQQKNQQYDLTFNTHSGKEFTCRTSHKKSIKATDFVVGGTLSYKVKGDKAKVKNTDGDEVSCTIVRVATASAEK